VTTDTEFSDITATCLL